MRIFGKDGIKGVFGITKGITPDLACKVGRAAVRLFGRGTVMIAYDSRVSSPVLTQNIITGINTERGIPVLIGLLPISAIAYFTKTHHAQCGIMITASSDKPENNGFKIFNSQGLKLSPEEEKKFEIILGTMLDREGLPINLPLQKNAYSEYCNYLRNFSSHPLAGLTIKLDSACGACAGVATTVFRSLGANVLAFNDTHVGHKINVGCGLKHPEYLLSQMRDDRAELGFVYDGDGDAVRIIKNGQLIDSDTVLYLLAQIKNSEQKSVIGTLTNNLALERALALKGIELIRCCVGNKFVTREVNNRGLSVGGENNGHYCVTGAVTTCDAIAVSILIASYLWVDGELLNIQPLSLFPQITKSYPVPNTIIRERRLKNLIEEAEKNLGRDGRVVVRMSGNGSKIRVMVESRYEQLVIKWHQKFESLIRELSIATPMIEVVATMG